MNTQTELALANFRHSLKNDETVNREVVEGLLALMDLALEPGKHPGSKIKVEVNFSQN